MGLRELTESLRVLAEKGATPKGGHNDAAKRMSHAAEMGKKAQERGDRHALAYWKQVYQNAKMSIDPDGHKADKDKDAQAAAQAAQTPPAQSGKQSGTSASGQVPQGDPGGADPSADGSGQPAKASISDRFKAAKNAVKKASAELTAKIKSAPASTKRLLTDPAYREKVGKKVAERLKKIPAKIIHHVIDEVKEVSKAGVVVVKAASGKKLTDQDKQALRKGAKALATTVMGSIALGGIAHLTASALAGHFAAETAVKAVGKAALYASLVSEAERDATTVAWVDAVIQGIRDGFGSLGDMDEEKLAEILSEVFPES